MIRSISALTFLSALSIAACGLDTDGDREIAAPSGAGTVAHAADASDPVPSFVDHDANAGGGSAVLVGAGAGDPQDAAAPSPDAGAISDASLPPTPPPPKPGPDDKKEGGKE